MHLLTMVFAVGVTEKLGDIEDSESCSPKKKKKKTIILN